MKIVANGIAASKESIKKFSLTIHFSPKIRN